MENFTNVTVETKANIYFDGKVTSRTVIFNDGEMKTLGLMLPGEYEFGTKKKEIMEVLQGSMKVKLPGENEWKVFKAGDSYEVAANSKFQLEITEVSDYCCSYIDG